jgi:hypothetical protein
MGLTGHNGANAHLRFQNTEVTVVEVTDLAVKHQVVIAAAAHMPTTVPASGEDGDREPTSLFATLRLARDDTPEGLPSAVHHVAVFEVTPT